MIRMLVIVGFILANAFGISHVAAQQDKKIALIVAINNYEHAPRLKNPVNDAKMIASVLEEIGFEVIMAIDLGRSDFEDRLTKFANKTPEASISLVYFAGHGIQVDGSTYLIPADAVLNQKRDVRSLIRAEDVLDDAARSKQLSVVILDACRNNPFTRSLAEAMGRTRSTLVGRGLSRIERVPRNTLIAYSTQAGNVALDGSGSNSPYALALRTHLKKASTDVRMVFGAVRDDVLTTTEQQQEPFTYGSLGGTPQYLFRGESAAPSPSESESFNISDLLSPNLVAQKSIVPRSHGAEHAISGDYAAWIAAKRSNNWRAIEALAKQKPIGLYGIISQVMLKLRGSNPSLSINNAILGLQRVKIDPEALSPLAMSVVQRKLAAASYLGSRASGRYDYDTRVALHSFVMDVYGIQHITMHSLVALAELADSQSVTASLSGRWKGRYFYPRPVRGVTSVAFEMDLVLSQGRVTGHVSEPATFGDGTSNNLYANFDGKVVGETISWKKTYDGTGGVKHSVYYSGIIDRGNRRIDGRWKVRGNWSGRFFIELN